MKGAWIFPMNKALWVHTASEWLLGEVYIGRTWVGEIYFSYSAFQIHSPRESNVGVEKLPFCKTPVKDCEKLPKSVRVGGLSPPTSLWGRKLIDDVSVVRSQPVLIPIISSLLDLTEADNVYIRDNCMDNHCFWKRNGTCRRQKQQSSG